MPAVPFIMAYGVASGAAATIGAAIVGATVSTAVATAVGAGVLSAGASLAQGKSLSDSLKGAVVGGVASFIGAGIASDVTSSIVEAAGGAGASSITQSLANVAGQMAGGGARGAIGAVLTGKDPIDALIQGGLTAGLTTGVMEGVSGLTKQIPGFSDLSKEYGSAGAAAQRAINAGLAAGVLGGDASDAVTMSLIGSLAKNDSNVFKNEVKDLSGTLRPTYDSADAAAQKLQANIDTQNQLVADYNTKLAEAEALQTDLQAKYDRYLVAQEQGNTDEANALAQEINAGVPQLEAQSKNLTAMGTQLEASKKQYAYLENSYSVKKSLLDEAVSNYQKQEEANAETIKSAFDNALAAKTAAEEAFGTELSQEQLDALIRTGDPVTAANSLRESLDGLDDEDKKSVLAKLNDGIDVAVAFAGEERAKNPDVIDNLKKAGLEEDVDLPPGIKYAGANTGTTSDAGGAFDAGTVSGRPIFAEDKRAERLEVPFGFRILSAKEEQPSGSFYDPTSNAWLVPETDASKLLNSSTIQADMDLFKSSQGDLDRVAQNTSDTSDDMMSDFLKSIGINTTDELRDSGLSNQDILNRIHYTLEAGGEWDDWYKINDTTGLDEGPVIPTGGGTDTTGLDEGPIIPTGGSEDDVPEIDIVDKRPPKYLPTDDDFPSTPITTPTTPPTTPVDDKGEVVIKGGRETCPVGTVLNPVTGECDPSWDEGGGDEPPTKTDPTTSKPVTPKPVTPKPVTPKPTTPGVKPTSSTGSFGFPVPETPQGRMVTADLANVYYFGKDFGSQKQKLNEEGELELEPYRAVGDPLNPFAAPVYAAGGGLVGNDENRENNIIDALDLIIGQSGNSLSLDDLLNIVKGS